MDRFLSILSLALAFASLVPAFSATRIRLKIMGVIISILLIGSVGVMSWSMYVERQLIEKVKGDIVIIFSRNNPMSFEQVYNQLNYVDYSTASTAIDELVDQNVLHHRPLEVKSESGEKYIVRVYNSVNWPIP
jgi:Tfp pilus assembly protein PilE